MTTFVVLIIATITVAAVDWWSVATDRRRLEYVLKPLTMVLLIAAALALPDPMPESAQIFIVVGLCCSLAGDIFLMLDERLFIGGLIVFLVGHVFYVVALLQFDITPVLLMIGTVLVLVAAATIGARIVRGAGEKDSRLAAPVAVYMAVISFMVACAIGTADAFAIVGAGMFYASDAILGWNRFVQKLPHGRLVLMTLYHLGQVGLVLALAS